MSNGTPTATPTPRPLALGQRIRLHARLSRPDQLLLIAAVYGWGVLLALGDGAALRLDALAWGLIALLLVSASVHFANEYADHETDALTSRTPFSGGSGALQAYQAPPAVALRAALVALVAGLAVAGVGLATGLMPWPAAVVLLIGAAGGWMYSLPPLALAWRGWGEVTNAILGAVVLPLYGFAVAAGSVSSWVLVVCLPFALLTFANLLATTWPDRDADRQVGKHTLATRAPLNRLRLLHATATGAAFLVLALLSAPTAATGLFLLPVGLWSWWAYTRQHSPLPSVLVMVLFLVVQMAAGVVSLLERGL